MYYKEHYPVPTRRKAVRFDELSLSLLDTICMRRGKTRNNVANVALKELLYGVDHNFPKCLELWSGLFEKKERLPRGSRRSTRVDLRIRRDFVERLELENIELSEAVRQAIKYYYHNYLS